MFDEHLVRKEALPDYKNIDFGQKLEISLLFLFLFFF